MSEFRRTILRKRKIRTPYVKDALVFFVFVLIATFFWFLYGFSKSKLVTYAYKIEYKNIPSKYIFSKKVPDSIFVEVEDIGFNHFFYSVSKPPHKVYIDLTGRFSRKETPIDLTNKELRKFVRDYIPVSAKINYLYPKKIKLEYGKLFQKKLPILLAGKVKLYRQYTLRGNVIIKPKEITVYGTRPCLDTMSAVYTEPLYLKNLTTTTFKTLALNLPEGVRVDTKNVDITIPVELFTEKTISIPVIGRNTPKTKTIRTFPAFVNITFFVGLSQYDKVKADAFTAYLDYTKIVKDNTGMQKILVQLNKDVKISNLRLTPATVEYIIEERYE